MSGRQVDKQRRRAEREARERELAARERRARRLRSRGAVAAGAVVLAGVAAVNGLGKSGSAELPPGSARPFGQHYERLQPRRVAAGVSTMAAPTASEHTHPHLAIWVNGRRVTIPADIGIDPRGDPGQMAGLHTHDDSGTLHNEGQADATLGQFFAVWGVPLSNERLGPYRAGNGRVVQMWVNGEPSEAWSALELAHGQHIRITFGARRAVSPPT